MTLTEAPTQKEFRIVISVDVLAEDRDSASNLGRIIALRLKRFRHPSLRHERAYDADVIEVRAR